MKKPTLRVTKWLGDLPVEGECTLCPEEPKFQPAATHHRPSKADYQEKLQRAFDRHLSVAHANDSVKQN